MLIKLGLGLLAFIFTFVGYGAVDTSPNMYLKIIIVVMWLIGMAMLLVIDGMINDIKKHKG